MWDFRDHGENLNIKCIHLQQKSNKTMSLKGQSLYKKWMEKWVNAGYYPQFLLSVCSLKTEKKKKSHN